MRIAVVLGAVHHRHALQAAGIDAEWLLEAAAKHSLEVYVDQSTEGSEAVRAAGLSVSVALKRSVVGIGGHHDTSDALQARKALHSHEKEPFDAILYGSDLSVDYAWHEPKLRRVPRGVCLGAGPAHDLRTVWQDRYLFARLARRAWSLAGLAASADFLVSDVAPGAFGLADSDLLPPRYTLRETTRIRTVDPSDEHRWVVVVTTSLGGRDLEGLMARVLSEFPAREDRTYAVITRPPSKVGRAFDALFMADVSESLRRQIVVVPTGEDGAAFSFLQHADVVVAASEAELAVPGIADAVHRRGWVLLGDAPSDRGASGVFPAVEPARRPNAETRVLSWLDPPVRSAECLEVLADDLDDDLLLIHVAGRAGPATGIFALGGVQGADVVVWGQTDALLGAPSPEWLYPFAFAVRGDLVPALARATGKATSIWDCICWLVSPEWIDRLRLVVMPAPLGVECWQVVDVEHVDTLCNLHRGVLPAPRWLPPAATELWPQPAAPERRRFASRDANGTSLGLMTWLRRTKWHRRARVLLPWRFGLLERAMKDPK